MSITKHDLGDLGNLWTGIEDLPRRLDELWEAMPPNSFAELRIPRIFGTEKSLWQWYWLIVPVIEDAGFEVDDLAYHEAEGRWFFDSCIARKE